MIFRLFGLNLVLCTWDQIVLPAKPDTSLLLSRCANPPRTIPLHLFPFQGNDSAPELAHWGTRWWCMVWTPLCRPPNKVSTFQCWDMPSTDRQVAQKLGHSAQLYNMRPETSISFVTWFLVPCTCRRRNPESESEQFSAQPARPSETITLCLLGRLPGSLQHYPACQGNGNFCQNI